MGSKPMIIGAISIGIAIGYVGGFLTFYQELSNVENVSAAENELESLKGDLEIANSRVSLLNVDNEELRSSLSEVEASYEVLRKQADSLQFSLESDGSFTRIEEGVMLIRMVTGIMPFEGNELSEWRLSVLNDTAKLDPTLVPLILRLVDSWVDIVQLEENEPEQGSTTWDQWNIEWQHKALEYIDAHNTAVSRLAVVVLKEIESLKPLI